MPVPQIDRLQFTSGPPGPSRQCSSKSRVIARDSSSTSNVSTISTRLQAQSTDSTAQQQQHDQEIKGLKQLVAQQQTLIQALQADVHELRSMLVQPAASHNSHNSSSSSSEQGPSSWHQRGQQTTVVPIIAPPPPPTAQQPQPQSQQQQAHQSQPQPQQLEHSGGVYQPMSVETFQSLPDKIILVRHAESLGNVDATTYSNTPDYEVRGTAGNRAVRAQPMAGRCCTQLHSPGAGQTKCPPHELLTMLSWLSRACSLVAHAPAMLHRPQPGCCCCCRRCCCC